MIVDIAIQAHPIRLEMANTLASQIGGRVVLDPDPDNPIASPWRTYRRCLESAPVKATHLLVIQDDAIVCEGFRDVVEAVVSARPDRLIVLCVCGNPGRHRLAVQTACQRGESWVDLENAHWLPVVATVWPVETARDLLVWVDEQAYPSAFIADDEICGRYIRARRIVPCATVPSLVDHADLVPSIISRRQRNGSNPGRQAVIFVDEHCDERAAEIDWSAPPPS